MFDSPHPDHPHDPLDLLRTKGISSGLSKAYKSANGGRCCCHFPVAVRESPHLLATLLPKMSNSHLVRCTTAGGAFLGHVKLREAHQLIREGRAKGVGGNKKREFQTLVRLDRFVDMKIPGGTLTTTYREHLGDTRSVLTPKRIAPHGGGFVKYDPDLTFAELHAGHFVSAATKLRRAEMHKFQIGAKG